MTEPDRSTVRAPTSRGLVIHGATVLTLVVAFLITEVVLTAGDHGPTAAMGLLLPGGPLLFLGLPWSLYFCADPYTFDNAGKAVIHLVFIGPAIVNVFLHGLYRHVRPRRPGD